MWILIFVGIGILAVAACFYLIFRLQQLTIIHKLSKQNKLYSVLLSITIFLITVLILGMTLNYINMIIILIFLVIFWILFDIIFWIIQKLCKRKFKLRFASIFALVSTIIYFSIGWVLAHHIWIETYDIQSFKEVESLKIVMFADSHIGTTFDGEGFAKEIQKIQDQNPDVVLICGDFIDDDTTKQTMEIACKVLGTLKTKYGIYYIFGNHDEGYYNYRDYTRKDLIENLEKNNVVVLEDKAVNIGEDHVLVGRCDASKNEKGSARKSIEELVAPLNQDKFIIVMNHQPNDYANEEKANVDLVLSGHTHGGQLFPVTYAGEWFGMNDKTYGYEKRNNTNFIVTSGISDWAIKFKMGCKSEIVVININ